MEPVVTPRTFSGRYEVTHLIARGGMAQVYRAQDTRLGRFVALKVLFPELSVDRTFVERFRREAQAAANLSHPNIVAVYDWGEDEGTYFIVMELITGTSLATALRAERTMPATRAAMIGAQTASALAYAHRNGVVHRDIKPGNVLLTDDALVKVTDFGIAQAVSTEEGLTMAGSVMGTAAYFSPEQAEGVLVDGRSDVYSLGIVLYEMLAGRPPYVGDSPVAVASMHVRNEPPLLRDLNPAVPEAMERIVMKALAKSPSDRYQTADELRMDLLRFTEGVPVHAGEVLAGVAATGVLAAAGTAAAASADRTLVVPASEPQTAGTPVVAGPPPSVPDAAIQQRGPNWRVWLTVALAALLSLVAFLVYTALSGPTSTPVPDVVGQALSVAENSITNAGLKVGEITRQNNSQYAQGIVMSTAPGAGVTVSPGTPINLVVSQGRPVVVVVPDVTGHNLTDAEAQLATAHLAYRLSQVQTWGSPAVPGTVLQQVPAANANANSGSVVTLTVLASGGQYPVPDVTSQSPAAAGGTLGQFGLVVGTQSQACSASIAKGLVVSTSPPVGTLVTSGATVNLVVSSGQCAVDVPNVLGLGQDQAISAITGAGLNYEIINACTPTTAGSVTSQDPPFGAKVQPGTTVAATMTCP